MELEKLASIFEAVRVLPLRPTDLLVFRSSEKLGIEEMADVHAYLEAETGHARILILTDGADLAVLRPEEEPPGPRAQPDPRPVHRPIATGARPNKAPGAI